MKRMFVTEISEGKKCGACNYETNTFYGIGETKKDARSNFDGEDGTGKGLCAQCMCDLIVEEKGKIEGVE